MAQFHGRANAADVLGTEPVDRVAPEGLDGLASDLRRRETSGLRPTADARAVDVLLWTFGDQRADGRGSRLGGQPFGVPGEKPTKVAGQDARFLAQFDFADSRDITGRIPGDVLQVFYVEDWDPGELDFTLDSMDRPLPPRFGWRWRRGKELLEPVDDAWKTAQPGVLVRTWDDERLQLQLRRKADTEPNGDESWQDGAACVIDNQLAKIGGIGVDNQTAFVSEEIYRRGERLIAQLHAWSVPRNKPWPWINRRTALDKAADERLLDFEPSGSPTVMIMHRRWHGTRIHDSLS